MVASIANPIVINSVVVFIRLYWFEKRFQKVVKDARTVRRTRTRSRTNSEARVDINVDEEERGVGNRQIKVLHAGSAASNGRSEDSDGRTNDAKRKSLDEVLSEKTDEQRNPNPVTPTEAPQYPVVEGPVKNQRGITFQDEVSQPFPERASSPELMRTPARRTTEQHIAFVEKQRNLKDKSTLRIPGPRDYDRGSVPQQVTDEDDICADHDDDDLGPQRRNTRTAFSANHNRASKCSITVEDAEPTEGAKGSKKLSWSTIRHPRKFLSQDTVNPSLRARTKSFADLITARTEDVDPMPYLSWHPTVGRNSAFIDLTEDQREELGGIEYRALKTLAVVLICKICVCKILWKFH